MSKRFEYKTAQTTLQELEATLNEHAQGGFKALHFHHPTPDTVFVVLGRKMKGKKYHDEYAEDEL